MNTSTEGPGGQLTPTRSAARRARLLELLPEHDWSIPKAGEAAGYSRSYSKTHLPRHLLNDPGFCEAILAKKRQVEAESLTLRVRVEKKLAQIIETGTNAEVTRAAEVLGRMCGWMTERRIIETDARLVDLSEAEQEEARQIAAIRLSTLRPGLPEPQLQAAVFEPRQCEPPPVPSLSATLDGTEPAEQD